MLLLFAWFKQWRAGRVLSNSDEADERVGQAPLTPPSWTEDERGIALTKPPLCKYCLRDLEAVTASTPLSSPEEKPTVRAKSRQFPKWMEYLPSNRKRKRESEETTQPLKAKSVPYLPLAPSCKDPDHDDAQRKSSTSTIDPIREQGNTSFVRRDPTGYIRDLKSLFTDSARMTDTETVFPPPPHYSFPPQYQSLQPQTGNGHANIYQAEERGRKFFPPAPTASATTLLTCTACGLAVSFADAKAGPEGRFFHRSCMVCRHCGHPVLGNDDDKSSLGTYGGDGVGADAISVGEEIERSYGGQREARWYCWAGEGKLGVCCRGCWVESSMAGEESERRMGFDGYGELDVRAGRGGKKGVFGRIREEVVGDGCVVA